MNQQLAMVDLLLVIVNKDVEPVYGALKPKDVIAIAPFFMILVLQVNLINQ